MTTLAAVTLEVAKIVTKVLQGSATAGTTTTLTDTLNLNQQNGFWKGGTLWLVGEEEALPVTGSADNKLTFPARSSVVTEGMRYAVIDADFPHEQLISAVNLALAEIGKIRKVDSTLLVDSELSVYDLSGMAEVRNIFRVEIQDPDDETIRYESTHWEEFEEELVFDSGWQPTNDDDIILIHYLAPHPEVTEADGEISDEISFNRLKWTAAVYALKWAVRKYGEDDSRKFAMYLQDAIQNADVLKKNRNKGAPVVRVHTAR